MLRYYFITMIFLLLGVGLSLITVTNNEMVFAPIEQANPSHFTATTQASTTVPTLNTEQIEVLHQTQAVLVGTVRALSTDIYITQTAYFLNQTDIAEALALGTDVFSPTETAAVATESSYGLTATSLIATATAYSIVSPTPSTPCQSYEWTQTRISYSEELGSNWIENPFIENVTPLNCFDDITFLTSHEIVIFTDFGLTDESFYAIFEDGITVLSEYPPMYPNLSEVVSVIVFDRNYQYSSIFIYSEAIAGYDSGLRGENLAEALDLQLP